MALGFRVPALPPIRVRRVDKTNQPAGTSSERRKQQTFYCAGGEHGAAFRISLVNFCSMWSRS